MTAPCRSRTGHPVIADSQHAFLFFQDPGVAAAQEECHALRAVQLFTDQADRRCRQDLVSFRIDQFQHIEPVVFLRYLPFPGLVLFIADQLGS